MFFLWLWLNSLWTPEEQSLSYHLLNFNAGYPAWPAMAESIYRTEFQQYKCGLVLKMLTKRHLKNLNNDVDNQFLHLGTKAFWKKMFDVEKWNKNDFFIYPD